VCVCVYVGLDGDHTPKVAELLPTLRLKDSG
jgi:hypothetical protein